MQNYSLRHACRKNEAVHPFCLALLLAAVCLSVRADEPKVGDSTGSETGSRRARMMELAKSYKLQVPNAPEPVRLVEKPLFSWATPERKAIGGEMYLWTLQGRPFASIGIWTYDDVRDSHELQSLAELPFQATLYAALPNVSALAKSVPWQPRVAGLEYRMLERADAPENTAVRRLAQAKAILRERFTANVSHDRGNTEELRLLAQPLYRYQPLPPGIVDGFMFAFAMGTDPEVLVMLEARTEGDSAAWYYAVAPSTSALARCSIDRTQIWTSEKQSDMGTFRMYINQ